MLVQLMGRARAEKGCERPLKPVAADLPHESMYGRAETSLPGSSPLSLRTREPSVPDAPPLLAAADLYKAHGLGNDYLVADEGHAWPVIPGAVAALCHPHRGAGSDGLVVVSAPSAGDPEGVVARLRGFNPDGTEFERSGNGLRIAASHLLRTGRIGVGEAFRVRIGGAVVEMTVHGREGGRYDVSVEMGRCRVGPEAVALDPDALDAGGHLEVVGAGWLDLTPVSVGNPHLVVWGEVLTADRLEEVGAPLAIHPALAAGSNVQLAASLEPGVLEALIWERGVGPTTASGTSACAVAVSAVHRGLQEPGPLTVRMEGGRLSVTVSQRLEVTLRGPVEEVMELRLTDGFLASLPSAGV